jgi:hypothetical protein
MAYSLYTQIEAECKTSFTTLTTPTQARVIEIIDEVDAEINSALKSAGYATIPPTATSDLALLRGKSIAGVTGRVEEILYSRGDVGELARAKSTAKRFEDFLTLVRDGDFLLPSATPASGITADPESTATDPEFTKSMDL